jgi:hypothetical protein
MLDFKRRVASLPQNLEVPQFEIDVLKRSDDWQVRSKLMVKVLQDVADLFGVKSVLKCALLELQKLFACLEDIAGELLTIQLGDWP